MRRYYLQFTAQCAALLPGARRCARHERLSGPWSWRPASGRALVAAAMLTALGLPLVAGAPTAAQAASGAPGAASTHGTRAAESQDGLIHITLIPGASEARYIMQVRTFGQPPRPATCSTRDVSGEVVLRLDGSVVSELSRTTVDQRSLRCAAPLRDDMAQQLLQTAQHPTATFIAQSAPGLPVPLTPGPQNYQMVGDQIVRGISRSVTYDTSGNSTTEAFAGSSRATLKMSDFGINPPKIGPLISVDDEMIAEVDIQAAVTAPPMPAAESADGPAPDAVP
jgi:polyisoprenoid-binding protein YceI